MDDVAQLNYYKSMRFYLSFKSSTTIFRFEAFQGEFDP